MRAAEYISAVYRNQPLRNDLFLKAGLKDIQRIVKTAGSILSRKSDVSTVLQQREKIGEIMSKTGAHVRNIEEIDKCILQLEHTIKNFQQYVKIKEVSELGQALRIKDMTVTAYVYLQTIKDYVLNAGQSRGSYLILYEPFEEINDRLFETINIDNGESNEIVQYVKYDCENVSCQFFREKVRSVPQRDTWFETVWNKYLKKDIYS